MNYKVNIDINSINDSIMTVRVSSPERKVEKTLMFFARWRLKRTIAQLKAMLDVVNTAERNFNDPPPAN